MSMPANQAAALDGGSPILLTFLAREPAASEPHCCAPRLAWRRNVSRDRIRHFYPWSDPRSWVSWRWSSVDSQSQRRGSLINTIHN